MAKIPVTVCIIAKNEEKYIEDCLKHLRRYDWEIVVTDTGSTDRTREIAAKYADQVMDFEWTDDFSAARNYCASCASNNWILAVDCDEFVKEADIGRLRILMQKFPRHVGVIRLDNLVVHGGGVGYNSDDVARFYNKNYYHFISPIHEQLQPVASSAPDEEVSAFVMPMKVVHHGYALRGEEMEKKQRRNLELLYKALEREPGNGYHYFQIAQSNFVLGNMDEAIASYEKAMGLVNDYGDLYVPEMIMSLAKAYRTVGREPDALGLLEKYSVMYATPKFTYEYARILQDSGQMLKALMFYIKVTVMDNKETLGDDLANCYGNIINIYRAMGQDGMAAVFQDHLARSIEEHKKIAGK